MSKPTSKHPTACTIVEATMPGSDANTSVEMTIGALAKACSVTVRTLRYYEEMDLIGPVKRSSGQYRLYNQHSQKRVMAILALQDLGFSLDEILQTLGAYSTTRDLNREQQLANSRRSLTLQQHRIDDKLQQLQQLRHDILARLDVIETICQSCSHDTPKQKCDDQCSYLTVHM